MKSKKIQYDATLYWHVVNRCNLNCKYCFCVDNLNKKIGLLSKIDIDKLIRTLDKTNKIFKITFLGGEPFLTPNIIDACVEITKKHYVSFHTNLTPIQIKEFCERINPMRVSRIHASLHIKELERYNLTDRFIENFLICKQKGFRIDAFEVAHPSLLPEVEKYKKFFESRGVNLFFSPFIGIYENKKYPEAYTKIELKIFGLTKSDLKIFNQKDSICNAGYNAGIVDKNGKIFSCYGIGDNLGNIYDEIKFRNHLIRCPVKFCGCPIKEYHKSIFKKAIIETKNLNNS